MSDELNAAPAPIPEPAAVEEAPVIPVTDPVSEPAPAQDEPAKADEPQDEAPAAETTESTEALPEGESDVFAEFDQTADKSKTDYERLFESDAKLKHTPHAARALVYAEVEKRQAIESKVSEIGGIAVLDTFKATFDAVLNPDPTQEQVDAAFESINDHNPKVLEKLGAGFTERWVKEVVADPVTNLSPLLQHTFSQIFGPGAREYGLNEVAELVQLAMARDASGEPILDLTYARELFEQGGGFNAFKHQQEKAQWEKERQELTTGFQQPAATQTSTQTFDVDADLEKEILPQCESVVTRLGYKKEDPEYSLIMDAMKYRMLHSPEADRIRGFAKSGTYKTETGFVQGVTNNKTYLAKRLYEDLVREMRVFQTKRKGAPAPVKETKPAPQAAVAQPAAQQPPPSNGTKPKTFEQVAEEAAASARKRFSDQTAASAVAAGN